MEAVSALCRDLSSNFILAEGLVSLSFKSYVNQTVSLPPSPSWRTDPSSQPPEGTNPAYALIFDFWLPELWNKKFLLFKPLSLSYFITVALAN